VEQILAIDPGSNKCGISIISVPDKVPLIRKIIKVEKLKDAFTVFFTKFSIDSIVIGNGTYSATIKKLIIETMNDISEIKIKPEIHLVDEKNTTLEANALYKKENPLPFPLCLIPDTLIPVNVPVDHYAAFVIGLRFLDKIK